MDGTKKSKRGCVFPELKRRFPELKRRLPRTFLRNNKDTIEPAFKNTLILKIRRDVGDLIPRGRAPLIEADRIPLHTPRNLTQSNLNRKTELRDSNHSFKN